MRQAHERTVPLADPRPRQMTNSVAGLLAHGSSASFRLPGCLPSKGRGQPVTRLERSLAAYSCGGSQGIGGRRLTLFPLASTNRHDGRRAEPSSGRIIGRGGSVSNRAAKCAGGQALIFGESRMVGVRGFEPPTPSSRTRCATRLRHTPYPIRGGVIAPKSEAGKGERRRFSRFRCFFGEGGPVAPHRRCRYVPPHFARQAARRPRALLGRSQVVRQRILIPPFGGSNPPAPANSRMSST